MKLKYLSQSYLMTTLSMWAFALVLLCSIYLVQAQGSVLLMVYGGCLVFSLLLRSTIGLLSSAFLGFGIFGIYLYLDLGPVISYFSVNSGAIWVCLIIACFFTYLLNEWAQSRWIILKACLCGMLCGVLMMILLLASAGSEGLAFALFLMAYFFPMLIAALVGIFVGLLGGFVYQIHSAAKPGSVIPCSRIGITLLFTCLCSFSLFGYIYPELFDLNYDGTYGTKANKTFSLQIQKKMSDLYKQKVKTKNITLPLGTLIAVHEWDYLCGMGDYTSFDDLNTAVEFRNDRIRSKWAYNDEYDATLFLIKGKNIVPVRLSDKELDLSPFDCLSVHQSFQVKVHQQFNDLYLILDHTAE